MQHASADVNTAFRIVVDGTVEVAISNTGNSHGWAYDAISFHGVVTSLGAGAHSAELQFRPASGGVTFNRAAWPTIYVGDGYHRLTSILCRLPPTHPPTIPRTDAPPPTNEANQ